MFHIGYKMWHERDGQWKNCPATVDKDQGMKKKKKTFEKHLDDALFHKSYLVKVLATTFTIATEIHMGEETA